MTVFKTTAEMEYTAQEIKKEAAKAIPSADWGDFSQLMSCPFGANTETAGSKRNWDSGNSSYLPRVGGVGTYKGSLNVAVADNPVEAVVRMTEHSLAELKAEGQIYDDRQRKAYAHFLISSWTEKFAWKAGAAEKAAAKALMDEKPGTWRCISYRDVQKMKEDEREGVDRKVRNMSTMDQKTIQVKTNVGDKTPRQAVKKKNLGNVDYLALVEVGINERVAHITFKEVPDE